MPLTAKRKSSTTGTEIGIGIYTEAEESFEQVKKSWEIAEKRK
jgi:hypothetical protein